MKTSDVLLNTLDMGNMVINAYIDDLSDAELKVRPSDGMNPIAWQLGHLLSSERHFVELVAPGSCPPLPPDFDAIHSKEAAALGDTSKFYSRDKYKELLSAQHAATRAVISKTNDAELDRTDASFPAFAPSVGALLNICGCHALMHCGQFVPVRRKAGKPVVI